MTPNEIISVVEAYRDGHVIEVRLICGGTWTETDSPLWDFSQREYRSRKPARVIWVNHYDNVQDTVYRTERMAKQARGKYPGKPVKYIEDIT